MPPKTSGLFGGGNLSKIIGDKPVAPPKAAAGGAGFGVFGKAVKAAKKPAAGRRLPNPVGNPFGNPFGGAPGGNYRIIKIEKIYNCVIYEKFCNELRRMIRKYPQKNINDIVKHLFHGCRGTDPKIIYEGEDGLDIRFSNGGAYGQGIYFANNSGYSINYAHPTGNGHMTMFVALVCTGDSKQMPGGNYRIPPNKPGS